MGMPGRTDGYRCGIYPTMPRAACGDDEGLSTHECTQITGIGRGRVRNGPHRTRPHVQTTIGDQALVTAGGRAGSRAIGRTPRAVHKRAGTPPGEHISTRRLVNVRAGMEFSRFEVKLYQLASLPDGLTPVRA